MSVVYEVSIKSELRISVSRASSADEEAVRPAPTRNSQRIEDVRRLHGHGLADDQIAERLDCSVRQVARIRGDFLGLRAAIGFDWVAVDFLMGGNGDVNRKLIHTADRIEAVRRLHEQGLTDLQISERIGLHDRQVFRIRHDRLGLPPVTVRGRNANATIR